MSDSGVASVVGPPRETDLQFFAYGIFRPDEIAWPRIISFVESSDESSIDGWELCERNGLPLATRNRDKQLSGHRVRFTDPLSAYEVIGNVEPSGEYKWESVIDSDGEKCNLLAAKKSEISTEPSQHWSSSRDPLFQFGMAFVSGVIRAVAPRLAQIGPFGESESDWKPYFECQGAFLTLWSIFERYAAFRYGAEFQAPKTTAKIYKTAESEKFKKAITKADVDQTLKVFSVRENRPKKIERDGRLY